MLLSPTLATRKQAETQKKNLVFAGKTRFLFLLEALATPFLSRREYPIIQFREDGIHVFDGLQTSRVNSLTV